MLLCRIDSIHFPRTPTIEVPDATHRAALAEEPDYDRETDEADLEVIGRGLQEAAEGKTIPGDVVLAALENTHTAQGDDA
ncbi:MAG: hypothetical protein H7145_20290, partial [Akkermansiaceae bacterium]|nr:hypothetical protein [Armatimonadota bacterium]